MRARFPLLLCLAAQALLALPAPGIDAPPGLVVSSGYVESKRIASGEAFPIWITFENRTGQEVLGLRFVDFRTAGLQPRGDCWAPINRSSPGGPRFPSCIPDSPQPTAPSALPQRLAPGEAVTVTADLVRTGRSGEFMLTGMYQWTDAKGVQRRALIPVGPIEVTKDWEDWRTRVREDFPTVLSDVVLPVAKDLGWPLAAFLLGLFLRFGEQRKAAIQETWNQMLPQIHDYTARHYLPISAAASEFSDAAAKAIEAQPNGAAPPKTDKAFYQAALLFRRMRTGMEEIGGIYLKDRDGEDLVVGAWNEVFDDLIESFPTLRSFQDSHEALDVLVTSIADRESFQDYRRKLSRFPVADIKDGFNAWIQRPAFRDLVLPLLDVFATAIDYEINRPYDTWYARSYGFDAKKLLALEKTLGDWLGKARLRGESDRKIEKIDDIRRGISRYRRRNEGRSWPPGLRWIAWIKALAQTP